MSVGGKDIFWSPKESSKRFHFLDPQTSSQHLEIELRWQKDEKTKGPLP